LIASDGEVFCLRNSRPARVLDFRKTICDTARALLAEAMQTGKSRDLTAAIRQLTHAPRK
jgi:hypothetical protein